MELMEPFLDALVPATGGDPFAEVTPELAATLRQLVEDKLVQPLREAQEHLS